MGASPFRPAEGPRAASLVLAELLRLWDQAAFRAADRDGPQTQKRLAAVSGVPQTTVNSWATGASLPRDLDQLTKVGGALAGWAGETPPTVREWGRLLRADQSAVVGDGRVDDQVGRPIAELTDPFALEVHPPSRDGLCWRGPASAAAVYPARP
jgi:hypothetical protein